VEGRSRKGDELGTSVFQLVYKIALFLTVGLDRRLQQQGRHTPFIQWLKKAKEESGEEEGTEALDKEVEAIEP